MKMSSNPGKRKVVRYEGQFLDAHYNWFVGEMMDKFISELGDGRLVGAKCPECDYVYVPPRSYCFKCHSEVSGDNLVELSGNGTLLGYTTASVELDGKGNLKDLEEAKVIGAIRLEEADSKIFMQVGGVDPEDLEIGMDVEVEWVEEPEGELSDIKYFKPA